MKFPTYALIFFLLISLQKATVSYASKNPCEDSTRNETFTVERRCNVLMKIAIAASWLVDGLIFMPLKILMVTITVLIFFQYVDDKGPSRNIANTSHDFNTCIISSNVRLLNGELEEPLPLAFKEFHTKLPRCRFTHHEWVCKYCQINLDPWSSFCDVVLERECSGDYSPLSKWGSFSSQDKAIEPNICATKMTEKDSPTDHQSLDCLPYSTGPDSKSLFNDNNSAGFLPDLTEWKEFEKDANEIKEAGVKIETILPPSIVRGIEPKPRVSRLQPTTLTISKIHYPSSDVQDILEVSQTGSEDFHGDEEFLLYCREERKRGCFKRMRSTVFRKLSTFKNFY